MAVLAQFPKSPSKTPDVVLGLMNRATDPFVKRLIRENWSELAYLHKVTKVEMLSYRGVQEELYGTPSGGSEAMYLVLHYSDRPVIVYDLDKSGKELTSGGFTL